jgi:hypothetical protein
VVGDKVPEDNKEQTDKRSDEQTAKLLESFFVDTGVVEAEPGKDEDPKWQDSQKDNQVGFGANMLDQRPGVKFYA